MRNHQSEECLGASLIRKTSLLLTKSFKTCLYTSEQGGVSSSWLVSSSHKKTTKLRDLPLVRAGFVRCCVRFGDVLSIKPTPTYSLLTLNQGEKIPK